MFKPIESSPWKRSSPSTGDDLHVQGTALLVKFHDVALGTQGSCAAGGWWLVVKPGKAAGPMVDWNG